MGNSSIGKIFGHSRKKVEVRIIIQGLYSSGKTTFLHHLKLGEVITTFPMVGFDVETVQCRNVCIQSWDVGGRDKVRPLYRHYYPTTQALIFVVDSADRERIDQVRKELATTVNEIELENCVFAIVANKQDLRDAMTTAEIRETLKLDELFDRTRVYNLFGSSAINGEGLYEVLEWILSVLSANDIDNKIQSGSKKKQNDEINISVKTAQTLKELVWT